MNTIKIDGSFGEGGGQILRTALSLSCITGISFTLFNIRKKRKKPGLRPQHITCANAISEISSGRVYGGETGSTTLTFVPQKIKPGSYIFDIKTAGSISLVAQTLIPPLLFADKPSLLTIKGGTHVPFCPIYNYISEVFIPMLKRIGIRVKPSFSRYGFYPKGGGEAVFRILPAEKIKSLNFVSKGTLVSVAGCSAVSNLSINIAERQKNSLLQKLYPLSANLQILDVPSSGAGTFVFLKAEYENTLSGFSSLGEKGVSAESVGREAADQFMEFHNSSLFLEPYLSDQIVLYLSLSRENSTFTTSRITRHLLTNLWVIEKFLKVTCHIEGNMDSEGKITIIHKN
ncbi:MAG: RNA 3'-phosphate cyclase [Candidatus Scalindua sp.]|nr:RNA 3'-phosphate cyclase [Candidatus Scalindua sp.]